MKLLSRTITGAFLAIAALSTPSAFTSIKPSPETCKILIEGATQILKLENERFRVGEVTRLEVATAELDLLDTRLECGDILKPDYCAVAVPTAKDILDATIQYQSLGIKTLEDVRKANALYAFTQQKCQQP